MVTRHLRGRLKPGLKTLAVASTIAPARETAYSFQVFQLQRAFLLSATAFTHSAFTIERDCGEAEGECSCVYEIPANIANKAPRDGRRPREA